mmetsp:Transcript_127398/g.318034  ORF Transcript_127398/g.318034 Transcript_127398/m.318034 type:complete len:339 (-) Transcript_127398:1154-2170(-)
MKLCPTAQLFVELWAYDHACIFKEASPLRTKSNRHNAPLACQPSLDLSTSRAHRARQSREIRSTPILPRAAQGLSLRGHILEILGVEEYITYEPSHHLQALRTLFVQVPSSTVLFQSNTTNEIARTQNDWASFAKFTMHSVIFHVAKLDVKLTALIASKQKRGCPTWTRHDVLSNADLHINTLGAVLGFHSQNQDANPSCQEGWQCIRTVGERLEDLLQDLPACPWCCFASLGDSLQTGSRTLQFVSQQQLRCGRQPRRQIQALGTLTCWVEHGELSPRLVPRPRSTPEVGSRAIRRETQHAVQTVKRTVMTKESTQKSKKRSHGPPTTCHRLLVCLG